MSDESEENRREDSSGQRARRGLLTLAAIVIVMAGMREAAVIVVPILLALFFAFVSSPLVFRLSRSRLPYPVAVVFVLLFELSVLVTMGLLVGTSATRFQDRLPAYRDQIGVVYADTASWLTDHGVPVQARTITEALNPSSLMNLIGDTVAQLGSMLSSLLLVVLVLAFTLFDSARLWRKVEEHFAGGTAGDHVLGTIAHEVNRYLAVKTSTSLVTGLLLGLWCTVLRLDFAVLWGLLAFLLNYVPNVGSILAAIPPVLLALLVQGWPAALLVGAGFLTVNMVIGNLIEPRLMGSALGISPVVVLLSIVVWGWILGPVGALLSVPLTMILKIALANTSEWAWIADLMSGAESPVRPSLIPDVPDERGPRVPEDAEEPS